MHLIYSLRCARENEFSHMIYAGLSMFRPGNHEKTLSRDLFSMLNRTFLDLFERK